MSLLRSLLFSTPLIALATIVLGTLSFLSSFFDRGGATQHSLAVIWGKVLMRASLIRVRSRGLEKLDPKGVYVFACNHGSYLDIPALLSVLPMQFRFFAKKGLFSIPFLGTHLKRARHLPVDRSSARNSLKSMTEGARLVAQDRIPVLLFPEGGRSAQGLREFTEGAAYIAIKAGAPLVPLSIVGLRDLLPMGAGHIKSGAVTICVGEPIPTSALKLSDRAELTARIYDDIARMMGLPAQTVPASR
jgi:1-acyl-sn-glycerol-3-phosphate acyltransferase